MARWLLTWLEKKSNHWIQSVQLDEDIRRTTQLHLWKGATSLHVYHNSRLNPEERSFIHWQLALRVFWHRRSWLLISSTKTIISFTILISSVLTRNSRGPFSPLYFHPSLQNLLSRHIGLIRHSMHFPTLRTWSWPSTIPIHLPYWS